MKNYNTFWKIIKDNRIEIPTIQRDYTYGRKSASAIREKLVNDIICCLSKNNSLNLDFVYGKLLGKENQISQERNRANIKSLLKTIKVYASDLNLEISDEVVSQDFNLLGKINFLPLDGQQRLTTLFLIHWYISQMNRDNIALDTLEKFSYSTRISSSEFCKMICKTQFDFNEKTSLVSEIISNNEGYFSLWRKDPTVHSMLAVIDEIHNSFRNNSLDFKNCWHQLTVQELITFDFFDLDDFELTDDLYIKMNARGKQLTNFEVFKSWLIKDYEHLILVEHWKKKFDLKWYDLFWKAKERRSYSVDSEFLQHFKILFLGDYLKSQNSEDSNMNDDSELTSYETEDLDLDDFKSVVGVLRKIDSNPIDIFRSADFFKTKVNEYVNVLDLLSFISHQDFSHLLIKYIDTDLSNLLFGEKLNKFNWWDTTLHYATTRYISNVNENLSHFPEWLRVISNLIYNTKIDTPKLFIEAVKSIDVIINEVGVESIYKIFSEIEEGNIPFFSQTQKMEEVLKSQLIVSDSNWERIFIDAENHKYFYGQIGFVFKLCKNKKNIDDFNAQYKKVAALFSENILNDHTFLLNRSLLAISDCFYKHGNDRMFNSNARGTLRNRNENWRRFLDSKLNCIDSLINRPEFDENDIKTSLKEIIKSEFPQIKDTYYGKFVNNYKLFLYPKKNIIRQYDKNYYLLNSSRISGYFVELYTYDWYLKNENGNSIIPKYAISYEYVKGQDNEPGIIFKKGNSVIRLKRDSSSRKYYITKGKQRTDFDTISAFVSSIK